MVHNTIIPKQTIPKQKKQCEQRRIPTSAADTGIMNFLPSMETAPLTQSAQGREGVMHIVEPVDRTVGRWVQTVSSFFAR